MNTLRRKNQLDFSLSIPNLTTLVGGSTPPFPGLPTATRPVPFL